MLMEGCTRRRVLATGGSLVAAAFSAGCTGSGGEGGEGNYAGLEKDEVIVQDGLDAEIKEITFDDENNEYAFSGHVKNERDEAVDADFTFELLYEVDDGPDEYGVLGMLSPEDPFRLTPGEEHTFQHAIGATRDEVDAWRMEASYEL